MTKNSKFLSRRDFLKAGSCGSMTIGPIVNTIAQLSLINTASASVAYNHQDYKALICIFLSGGCDANNIIIPKSTHPYGEIYADQRGLVGVPNGVNSADQTLSLKGSQLGLHPSFKNIQKMYNQNNLSFVTNVGTLAEPTTKQTYSKTPLPTQLFSHADQQNEWMSSIADQPYTSGWGARVADLYHSVWNPSNKGNSKTSMLITASGGSKYLSGGSVNPYSISSSGATSLIGFGENYKNAYTEDNHYKTNTVGVRLKALERIMQYSHAHVIEEGYSEVFRSGRENEELFKTALDATETSGVDFDGIWKTATSSVANELKTIARLIAGREHLGNNRQIFFVNMGGFDTHESINQNLPKLLSDLDQSVGAFDQTMKALADADKHFSYDQVTTFNGSDFNRTWTPNKPTEDAGTDHAWGTHSFVFGGAVQGGALYGEYPRVGVNGQDDVPNGTRGRWIPTTSVDQYAATLANWFGVPKGSSEMETIFPNLYRFVDPFSREAKLGIFG